MLLSHVEIPIMVPYLAIAIASEIRMVNVCLCRGFSTFHAIEAAACALYLLLISDLFYDSREQLVINRSSTFSNTTLGVRELAS